MKKLLFAKTLRKNYKLILFYFEKKEETTRLKLKYIYMNFQNSVTIRLTQMSDECYKWIKRILYVDIMKHTRVEVR